jgi:hypothetical protein
VFDRWGNSYWCSTGFILWIWALASCELKTAAPIRNPATIRTLLMAADIV